MLTLVLAESALETVPVQVLSHPEVQNWARQTGLNPRFTLLDRSYHHHAMKGLEGSEKRGRPDIVHLALLGVLETPLNMEDMLRVYVHTAQNLVLEVNPRVRLPRNYLRFKGLIEQLFQQGRVPPKPEGEALLTLRNQTLKALLDELKPDLAVGLTREGKPVTLTKLAQGLVKAGKPVVVVGGFPKGRFTDETKTVLHQTYCIDPAPLEAWVVASRLVYAVEKALGIEEKRLRTLKA